MRVFVLLACLLVAQVAWAQPRNAAQEVMMQDSIRLRNLGMALQMYGQDHDGRLPPDLASTLDYLGANNDNPAQRAKNIANTLIAPGIPAPKVPDDAKAEWVNQNSSYAYLGAAGIEIEDIPQWNDVVIAHLKLDAGHPSTDNPAEQLFNLAFIDGHVEVTNKATAERLIENSRKTLEAVRTGGALPEAAQSVWDMGVVSKALHAYAKDHKNVLPPDLGSALEYVPKEKRLATGAQRAGVFLSPTARKNIHIPENPTPEWVNRNTSWTYLAASPGPDAKPLLLSRIEDIDRIILVHGRMDAPLAAARTGQEAIPVATVRGSANLEPKPFAEAIAAESKKVLDATRHGLPLPDYQHSLRDLRLLFRAINAYAAAHNGQLPADLGATLAFLPAEDLPTPEDRARVYLSPRTERVVHVPDELTPEWIIKNASYVYLAAGAPPITLKAINAHGEAILLHGPLDEVHNIPRPGTTQGVIPVLESFGTAMGADSEWVQRNIAETKEQLKALRAK